MPSRHFILTRLCKSTHGFNNYNGIVLLDPPAVSSKEMAKTFCLKGNKQSLFMFLKPEVSTTVTVCLILSLLHNFVKTFTRQVFHSSETEICGSKNLTNNL